MTLYPLRDDTCLLALPMHEGSGNVFYDHSRYSHNATFYGDTIDWLDSPFGKVVFFAGTDDHYAKVSFYEIMKKIKEAGALTITAWINTGEDGQILTECQEFPYPICGYFNLEYRDGGKIYFKAKAGSCETSGSFADGLWHFIAAQAGPDFTRIYVDGNKEAENGDADLEHLYISSQMDAVLYIGTEYSPPSNLFNGFICDLRIYNRILSQDEIKALELYYRNFEVRPSILCPRPTL